MRFDVLEPPRTGSYCTLNTFYPLKRCSWRRFGTVEPPRTRVKEIYIPCYLREDVVREGSVQLNHPELLILPAPSPPQNQNWPEPASSSSSCLLFLSPTTSLQGIQGVQGAICTGSGRFKHIEPHRTFSNYILTEIARYIDFFHTSSWWFDCTEPSLTTSLQGIEGVQGAICDEVEAHRTSSNILELHPHRNSKVYRLLSHEFGVVRVYRTFSNNRGYKVCRV